MLEKVAAVYPNTYRAMDERQRARIIVEWYRSLKNYSVRVCQRAWEKYKTGTKMRELNLALFIGFAKDVIEAEKREQARKALPIPEEPNRDEEWQKAKEACMKKCREVFGR